MLEVWAEEDTAAAAADAAADASAEQQDGDDDAAAPGASQQASPRGLLLQFSVRDTGIGISQENIGRLFQR